MFHDGNGRGLVVPQLIWLLRWRDGINHLHYTIIQEKVTS